MKRIFVAILLVVLILFGVGNIASPVNAQDYPFPPLSPETPWQPPYEGTGSIDLSAKVELYGQIWSNLQIPPPSPAAPGVPSSIIYAYLVNNYGQILTNLYRNGSCYLVLSVNGPGYLYLWEYYPYGACVLRTLAELPLVLSLRRHLEDRAVLTRISGPCWASIPGKCGTFPGSTGQHAH